MRVIKTLTAIGLILGAGYVLFIGIYFLQMASERVYCRTQPQDKMPYPEYQYCNQLNKELR